jgi:hypothetical protein
MALLVVYYTLVFRYFGVAFLVVISRCMHFHPLDSHVLGMILVLPHFPVLIDYDITFVKSAWT